MTDAFEILDNKEQPIVFNEHVLMIQLFRSLFWNIKSNAFIKVGEELLDENTNGLITGFAFGTTSLTSQIDAG